MNLLGLSDELTKNKEIYLHQLLFQQFNQFSTSNYYVQLTLDEK